MSVIARAPNVLGFAVEFAIDGGCVSLCSPRVILNGAICVPTSIPVRESDSHLIEVLNVVAGKGLEAIMATAIGVPGAAASKTCESGALSFGMAPKTPTVSSSHL